MKIIDIEPFEIKTITIIKSIEIGDGQLILNQSVKFPVKLLDENGSLVSVEIVEISGDEYSKWGSDDNYITNITLSKLGVEKRYKNYDLIDLAKSLIYNPGDGRISKENAEELLKFAIGCGFTDMEKKTFEYMKSEFNWTDLALEWFDNEISK